MDELQKDGGLLRSIPLRVHQRCAEVLLAVQDERSGAWIALVFEELRARAADINDEEMRRAFLKSVPEHRALAQMAQQELVNPNTGA